MIFNTFDPNKDVVAGRTTRVASGFWPNGVTDWFQATGNLIDDFWSLTGSVGNPSFGASPFDVRRTMYYLNMFPGTDYFPNDPYLSIAYGNIYGELGSGSFAYDVSTIQAFAPRAIYQQYKNILLGATDLDGMFSMKSGSAGGQVNASDIWVMDFSAFKMKDRIDEGFLQFSLSGSSGSITLIDDSQYSSQNLSVYELVSAPNGLDNPPAQATYEGIGLFYPANGVVILNASVVAAKLGITATVGVGSDCPWSANNAWPYQPELESTQQYTYNHKTFAESLKLASSYLKVRKTEYVNSRHYFVRILNRDFNYSNNPTYVYDGTDGIHAKGTIRNADFISDPKTYITTIGLYNDNNELVAVAKLSRPALKSFDEELLVRVRLDF